MSKKRLRTQRQLIDKKLSKWLAIKDDQRPPSGWIKAVRTALGMNTRQLAQRLGIQQPAVTNLEARESKNKITLELIERTAAAMGCKFVYAIVPDAPHLSLDSLVNERSQQLATDIVRDVEHSMQLEAQGSESVQIQIEKLAYELLQKMDSRLWEPNRKENMRRRKK